MKKINWAPATFRRRLIRSLTDKNQSAYGQVATTNPRGQAEVRTVHLVYSELADALVFNTHIQTRKFAQIEATRYVAGAFYDSKRQTQFRWKGRVQLLRYPRTTLEKRVLDAAWLRIGPTVREAYWREHGEKRAVTERCTDCVTVLCVPVWWDIYQLNSSHYLKGKREVARLSGGRWKVVNVSVLTGK